ncbi:retrovirus-related pol polyprotein from transposon TNT 1-94 [Tanacetum coccineum]
MCDEFAKIMHDEFEMSMMGELNFFLGLQIKQMEDGLFFNRSKYIKEMLKKFGLEDSKPMKTPMSSDTKLTKDEECESVDSTKYQGMIDGQIDSQHAQEIKLGFPTIPNMQSKKFLRGCRDYQVVIQIWLVIRGLCSWFSEFFLIGAVNRSLWKQLWTTCFKEAVVVWLCIYEKRICGVSQGRLLGILEFDEDNVNKRLNSRNKKTKIVIMKFYQEVEKIKDVVKIDKE